MKIILIVVAVIVVCFVGFIGFVWGLSMLHKNESERVL